MQQESRQSSISEIPRFGVLLYDDPTLSGPDESGWCAASGGSAARFSRHCDLPSDTIWVTNVDYTASAERGLNKVHNIRGKTFLPTSLDMMAEDLQLSGHDVNLDVAARALSSIIDRSCRNVASLYGFSSVVFGGYSLATGLQRAIFDEKIDISAKPDLYHALESAYQRNSSCDLSGTAFFKQARTVRLRPNRISHAQDVLKGLVPDGPVEYLSERDLSVKEVDFWLEQPVLANVSVSDVDPAVSRILAFGSTYMRNKKLRTWASTPELLLLQQYAKVKIKGLFRWERAVPLTADKQLPPELSDPLIRLSYSAGQIAEAHLSAALSPTPSPMGRIKIYTARAVFLAARERVALFCLAKALSDEGFRVMSYGAGSVSVRVPSSGVADINEFVRESGLSYPMPIHAFEGDE